MKVLITGAGQVGRFLGGVLSQKGHDVTLIDHSEEIILQLEEEMDARLIRGNGSSASVLIQAEVSRCDFFLAMTSDDCTNLVASSIAKALGAKVTLTRVHDQTYADNSILNYQLHFGIDYLINPEFLSAIELAKRVRHPHRVAVENFAQGQIEVQQIQVKRGAKAIGSPLKDLKLSRNTRIGLIQRDTVCEVAHAHSVIAEGDLVTLFGQSDALYESRQLFDPQVHRESVRVVLFGGSEIAIGLIRLLSNPRFKIRIIEKDPGICRHLAEKFPEVTVINGEGTSLRLLEEEQVGSADYFIACTKEDEDNIMTCLQAGKLGAKHVQLVINKPDYEEVLEQLRGVLGVQSTIAPRIATAEEVLRYIDASDWKELVNLPGNTGSIVEIRIGANNPLQGKTLREISLPPGCIIVALLHQFQARVPGADDKILAGDRMLVIVSSRQESIFRRLLNG